MSHGIIVLIVLEICAIVHIRFVRSLFSWIVSNYIIFKFWPWFLLIQILSLLIKLLWRLWMRHWFLALDFMLILIKFLLVLFKIHFIVICTKEFLLVLVISHWILKYGVFYVFRFLRDFIRLTYLLLFLLQHFRCLLILLLWFLVWSIATIEIIIILLILIILLVFSRYLLYQGGIKLI